jgi:hypothetical protein
MRCFDASRIDSRQAVSFVAVLVIISRLVVHEWITIDVLLAGRARLESCVAPCSAWRRL